LIRIIVDLNLCQAFGQCGFAAPAVFQLHGETLVYDPMPPEALRGDICGQNGGHPISSPRTFEPPSFFDV